jgi:hypothetical protein
MDRQFLPALIWSIAAKGGELEVKAAYLPEPQAT